MRAGRPFRSVVPLLCAAAAALWPTYVGAITVSYYGGPVISNVQVIQVNWGSSIDPTLSAALPSFYTAVTGGPYFDWLYEYSTRGLNGAGDGQAGSDQVVGRGSFGGGYTISPSITATSITDAQIQSELAAQIAAQNLPQPSLDAHGFVNSLYMIDFPNGITISFGGTQSCEPGGFCAYHGTIVANGKDVPYAVLPFIGTGSPCQGACGGAQNDIDNEYAVHSQQLANTVTDAAAGLTQSIARPLAWYDDALGTGEIGSICNAQQAVVSGYTVQKEWSNVSQACIASVPGLPVCDGSPTRCRPCYAGDAGVACTGAKPSCDTAPLSATFGFCVATTSTTTTSTTLPGGATTTTLPGSADVCGNCTDDDQNGLTDFEDVGCCSGNQQTTLMPHKITLAPGAKGVKVTLTATLPQAGLESTRPLGQDLYLQVLPNGAPADVLCAHVPATDLKATKSAVSFDDPKGLVPGDFGIQHVAVRRHKDGSAALKITGKHVTLTLPPAGMVQFTFALRDPATAESGNRCGTATVTLRAKRKGVLVYP
jgi:hypothetical protein